MWKQSVDQFLPHIWGQNFNENVNNIFLSTTENISITRDGQRFCGWTATANKKSQPHARNRKIFNRMHGTAKQDRIFVLKSKLEIETRNQNSKSKLEIKTRNRNSKSKLEIKTRNRNSKSKLEIETRNRN